MSGFGNVPTRAAGRGAHPNPAPLLFADSAMSGSTGSREAGAGNKCRPCWGAWEEKAQSLWLLHTFFQHTLLSRRPLLEKHEVCLVLTPTQIPVTCTCLIKQ